MKNELLAEFISKEVNAKTLLLFGGNVERRHEIISLLQPLTNLTVYGALSESEGIEQLKELKTVDFVLIGGRYSEAERIRIRAFLHKNYPEIKITEPGYEYTYSNENILMHLQNLLNLIQKK
jgi:hypothetical protein